MSSCIAPAQPTAPRVPYSLFITLLKHLIPVPLSGLANRREGPAKTVKEATRASVVIAVSSDKRESRDTWVLSGREQGEHLN